MQNNIHLKNKLYFGQSSLITELSSTEVKPFYIMKKEIWKAVKNYEGIYEVSNLGNVRSLHFNKQKILKPAINGRGYLHVVFSKNGKYKTFYIHQLVAMCFLEHERCGMKIVINHKDKNQKNNHIDNLEILTQFENIHHSLSNNYKERKIGIILNKKTNRWVALFYINGKNNYIGTYRTEIEAINAREKYCKLIK
jgi:hypothetical protein